MCNIQWIILICTKTKNIEKQGNDKFNIVEEKEYPMFLEWED
jgi:hypothetical protein